jgi:hypothetical protein
VGLGGYKLWYTRIEKLTGGSEWEMEMKMERKRK